MIHHRDGIRPRPIDDHKPYLVVKDLSEAKLISNKEGHAELCNIEKELYKVLDYFDKIRKKQIPKSKIINDKNDNKKNYNINNNIIYINENNENSNKNNSEYVLNYKLSEYKRPEHYILYSSSQKNKINTTKKDYEAKEADTIYLDVKNHFMKIEELEDIMIDLENKTTNEKDDKINEEIAKTIVEQQYAKYKKQSDSIITHFKDRRNSIKKSLIRKKWHTNKSTDKYLNNTFRKRERHIIKTRKNNQNKEESLNKIIESESSCKNFLLPVIKDMTNKEISNKHLLKLEELFFFSECDKIKKTKITQIRIQENAIIKENIENIEKSMKLINKRNEPNDIKINKEPRSKINNGIIAINGINGTKNINGNSVNNNYNNIIDMNNANNIKNNLNNQNNDIFLQNFELEDEHQFTFDVNDMTYKQFKYIENNKEFSLFEELKKKAINKLTKIKKEYLKEETLMEIFKTLDKDNKGKINKDDIKKILNKQNLDENEYKQFIDKFDLNGDGEIDYYEFITNMNKTNISK